MKQLLTEYKLKCAALVHTISKNTNNGSIQDEKRAARLSEKLAVSRELILKVEALLEQEPENKEKFDWTSHGDFKKYYDPKVKRNFWVLGYFGGGSIAISDTYNLAKQYSESTGVPLENIKIDEITSSRRFKHFKFMYSTDEVSKEADAEEMENVYAYLRD